MSVITVIGEKTLTGSAPCSWSSLGQRFVTRNPQCAVDRLRVIFVMCEVGVGMCQTVRGFRWCFSPLPFTAHFKPYRWK